MTTDDEFSLPRSDRPDAVTGPGARADRVARRREKIVNEITRNRRKEFTVPTWVLVACLAGVIAAWAALIIFAS